MSFLDNDRHYPFKLCDVCGGNRYYNQLPPTFWATPACRRHDISYLIGGTRKDKIIADKQFWYDLKILIKFHDLPFYYYAEAYALYLAAINFGNFYWREDDRLDV